MQATRLVINETRTTALYDWRDIQRVFALFLGVNPISPYVSYAFSVNAEGEPTIAVKIVEKESKEPYLIEPKERQAMSLLYLIPGLVTQETDKDDWSPDEVYTLLEQAGWRWLERKFIWVYASGDNSSAGMRPKEAAARRAWQKIMGGDDWESFSSINLSEEEVYDFLEERGWHWSTNLQLWCAPKENKPKYCA